MKELIIIGAGPVGIYAAFLAGLRGIDTLILESNAEIGGRLVNFKEKVIFDIPGYKGIKAYDFILNLHEQYLQFASQIPLNLGEKLIDLAKIKDGYQLTTNKSTYQSKMVLFAHGGGGFVPVPLAEGKNYDNVFYTFSNISQYQNKKVLVFGGGDSALSFANELLTVTKDITVIHRRPDFRAMQTKIDSFIKGGGKLLTPYVVKDLVGNHHLDEVVLANVNDQTTITIKCDFAIVNFGVIMATSKCNEWGLDTDKALIKVDASMRTNLPNIYAIGDGATYQGKVKMITSGLGEAVTAITQIENTLHPEKNKSYSSEVRKEL